MTALPDNHRDNDPWHQVADGLTATILLRDAEIARLNGQLRAIEGALNCENGGPDAETVARKLYHEHADAMRKLTDAESSLQKGWEKEANEP